MEEVEAYKEVRHKKQQDDWRQAQADAAHLSEQQYKRVAASEEACKREREISYTLPRVSRAGIIGAPPRSVPVRCATDGEWDSQSGHTEPPPPGLATSQVLRHGEAMTPPKGDARQWPALVGTPGGLHSRIFFFRGLGLLTRWYLWYGQVTSRGWTRSLPGSFRGPA